jgi:hypothetical protein
MKKGYLYVVVFISIAAVTQWAAIKYIPNLVHAIAVHRVKKINVWVNAGKTDAAMRKVVMPNPDFIYSALFYDVNSHDITVSGYLPDSGYASVAFYDDRCQPYYVYNNLEPNHTGPFTFSLSSRLVKVIHGLHPLTNTGVIICRYLLKSDTAFARIKNYQGELRSEVR